jgi:uncharacterized membrane protein YdbT with pleckstrin-like domain
MSIANQKQKTVQHKRENVMSGVAMDHIRQMLLDGEKIIHVARISPFIFWKTGAVAVLAIFLLVVAKNLGIFMLLVTLLMGIHAILARHFLMLALSNKRVFFRYGILQLDVVHIHLRKIESVELSWTVLGQLLGYASVVITGTGSRVAIIPFVADAAVFRKRLEQELVDVAESDSANGAAHRNNNV